MKIIKKSFLFFLSIILFMSCYKEGGNNFFAKSKIVGYWSIESLSVDGVDSTANIKANPNFSNTQLSFGKRVLKEMTLPPLAASA